MKQTIMVTGGAGFIGSNFIRYVFEQTDFKGSIVNVDSLTYAGNLASLADVQQQYQDRYHFEKADICDTESMPRIFDKYGVDKVVHFAAESHVDRSIEGSTVFIRTNILGTHNLLEVAREKWQGREDVRFHHVSTDEVYGSLGQTGFFYEDTPYDPRSPYSASKASSDHLVRAAFHTHNFPVTISNCSNNYGPYQFPEKLLPLMILNMLNGKELPVYGDGKNIRDWLYVDDHNSAVWSILNNGEAGRTYNIGGENEWENIKLIKCLCKVVANKTGKAEEDLLKLIAYVKDRPGHDRRYAINCDRIKSELGWKRSVEFERGLEKTVDWYLENAEWIDLVQSGKYRDWIEENYTKR